MLTLALELGLTNPLANTIQHGIRALTKKKSNPTPSLAATLRPSSCQLLHHSYSSHHHPIRSSSVSGLFIASVSRSSSSSSVIIDLLHIHDQAAATSFRFNCFLQIRIKPSPSS